MAANSIFIDTNILVYANSSNSEWNKVAIEKLKYYENAGYDLWISRQVLREYLVIMSRLMQVAGIYDDGKLVSDIEMFELQFFVADETVNTTQQLLKLVNKYKILGKSIHDCAIVAAINTHKIQNLLTHNVADFTRYQENFKLVSLIDS